MMTDRCEMIQIRWEDEESVRQGYEWRGGHTFTLQ